MKSVFICAMADTLSAASVDIRNGDHLFGPLEFHSYLPPTNHPLPFVPAYLQDYYLQPKLLKSFLRSDACKGLYRHCDYLLALADDCTDLEAHALNELLTACGAKSVSMEYQAFLLSSDPSYLAVTASKRSVCVTHVIAGKDETERIFIPMDEASEEQIFAALNEMDSEHTQPVYTFGLPEALEDVGDPVHPQTLARNFIRLL